MSFCSTRFLLTIISFHIFSFSIGQTSIEKADDAYDQGKEYYYDGNYKEAIIQFEEALKAYQNEKDILATAKTYRRLADAHRYLKFHQEALSLYEQSFKSYQKLDDFSAEEQADLYIRIGHTYSQMYLPKKANEYYYKSLDIYKEEFGETSSEVANLYMNIGISALQLANYRNALLYFEKAFSIFKIVSEPNSVDFNRIYSNLGYLYRKMGDYDRAIAFGEKALEIKLINYPPNHPSVPKYYRNIGRAYQEKGEAEKALPYYEKTVALAEEVQGKDHPSTGGAYGELGNVLAELGQYERALSYYFSGKRILEARYAPTHPYLVAGYFNIGRVYEDQGEYDQALALYQEVLDKFAQSKEPPKALVAKAKRQIAGIYLDQEQYTTAIQTINQGLQVLCLDETWTPTDEFSNPPLSSIHSEVEYLKLLQNKAWALEQRAKTKNISDLEAAFKTSKLCLELIQQLNQLYPSESSRTWLYEDADPIYRMGIRQAFELFEQTNKPSYLEEALAISNQNKANLLSQQLQTNQARRIAQLPEEEIQAISQLETELQTIREKIEDAPTTETQKQYRDAKIALEQKEQYLQNTYPAYNQLKFQTFKIDIVQLQSLWENLPSPSALIDLYYTDEAIYTFLLSANGLKGFKTAITADFQEHIQTIKDQNISSILTNSQSNSAYYNAMFQLYEVLITPIKKEIRSYQHISIIPHDILHYLSFDLLAPKQDVSDYKQLDYLIKHHSINYAWSLQLWTATLKETTRAKDPSFVGFAPNFAQTAIASNTRSALENLAHTQEEVSNIQSLLGGQTFTGAEIDESQFLDNTTDASIIHFATHAIANDDNPSLSGLYLSNNGNENGFLSNLEIYDLDLSADMVVMSACNTAKGKLIKGEGVMNLGRAFTFAGAKSVLMSLWLANDQSTAIIMKNFYQQLKNGKSKDEALRLAKLAYIDQADPLQAHPYFWAGMIANGQMNPINRSFSFAFLWWLLPLLGLLSWWILRKNR
jgi:CHAT domain-containing protein